MATMATAPTLYPSSSLSALRSQYVGQQLRDVQAPAAVLDAAVVRKNCRLMLEATEKLGVGFRAHVKTHKTTEITKLQVGSDSQSVKLVCSTVSEIEHLLPWLLECKAHGRSINVLYGLPLSPSQIPRLAKVALQLGEETIGIFADHPLHIKALDQVDEGVWPGRIPVWVNIDVGDHREGVTASSPQLAEIAHTLQRARKPRLAGLYTHLGSSYGSNSPEDALKYMSTELNELIVGAKAFLRSTGVNEQHKKAGNGGTRVTLSLGASPTATATQNLLYNTALAADYRAVLEKAKRTFDLEFHAGVYTVNDLQQIAARARPACVPGGSNPEQMLFSCADIGFRILVEVASVYPDRTDKFEALIAAGTIVLGREPCKSYPGWGIVTPWPARQGPHYDPEEAGSGGLIVGRISQEHGIVTWEGPEGKFRHLEVGEKLMVWPNHACIAGVSFGWYLVVDSDEDDPDEVRDVWVRWRGW